MQDKSNKSLKFRIGENTEMKETEICFMYSIIDRKMSSSSSSFNDISFPRRRRNESTVVDNYGGGGFLILFFYRIGNHITPFGP